MVYPNVTSLNHARELVEKGIKIKHTFEDFVESVRLNLEPSFKYKKDNLALQISQVMSFTSGIKKKVTNHLKQSKNLHKK